jgi:1,4-dihydroxy-2-naphthoate octaprenyltransferase
VKRIGAKQTAVVMACLVLSALVWEAIALMSDNSATISELVWSLSANPFFVFMCGVLMGHFFFVKSHCVNCGKNPYRKEA